MKRIFAMMMALMMVLALAVPTGALAAEEVDSLVVFGDSISTGYGLNGTLYTRASYANLIASALGLSENSGYVNYAVDGYTSADILRTAKTQASAVAGADLIMMTNGGNDVLSKMLMIAIRTAGVDTLDLASAAVALMMMDAEQVNAGLYSAENNAVIEAALAGYRTNLTELVTYLKQTNPDARVLFLTQYNPLSGVTAFAVLDAYAEDVIGQLNSIMTEVVTAAGYETIDTHAVMVGQGQVLSNILLSDIHPNTLGHAMMAQKIKTYLGLEALTTTEQTTTAEPETTTAQVTTAASEPTVVQTTTVAADPTTAQQVTTDEPTAAATADATETTTSPMSDNEGDTNRDDAEKPKSSTATVAVAVTLVVLGAAFTTVGILIRRRH